MHEKKARAQYKNKKTGTRPTCCSNAQPTSTVLVSGVSIAISLRLHCLSALADVHTSCSGVLNPGNCELLVKAVLDGASEGCWLELRFSGPARYEFDRTSNIALVICQVNNCA